MKLEFRLLGDIAVLEDGRPLDLGGTRQRSVFALLVLQRDRAIATELLADRLWPDEQPLTAIKTIQVYISRIRHALGPHAGRLTSSSTGYRLAVADDELDAARFERGLREAREALASGSVAASLTALEVGLSLWSGPALGDLASEQFARREADRLEELRLQALEERFELRIDAGSSRETIAELRRLLVDQPGRERLWRLLMLALYADGRQGEALQAYQDARRYLADELGLDPGVELRELERAILNQEAARPRQTALVPTAFAGGVVEPENAPSLVARAEEPAERQTRRVVTVLRAEVVRSSSADVDPENAEALGRRALGVVRRAVERHGGTIERADHRGVNAVFGLAVAREDDALRAIRAAVELGNASRASSASDAMVLRLGVATGEVLSTLSVPHGSILAGVPLDVATRLAGRARPHEALLGAETAQMVGGATLTDRIVSEPGSDAIVSSAVRLVALTEGEAMVRPTTTPFVGRLDDLDRLLKAFERVVSDGTTRLITVIGAPGIGKSRLVAEAFNRISDRSRILRSRCLPYGEGITYLPVRDLVLAASGIGPGDSRDEALSKLHVVADGSVPGNVVLGRIATLVGLADEPAPAEEIPWAVRRFFETLAAERPLVLLVDDLQWAEPALIDLLDHVLDLGQGPILLVTIARPELEEVHAEWLARSNLAIRLESLADDEAATLLDGIAPGLPSRSMRSRILSTAEGNPLFVEQFVAYVLDMVAADGGWRSDPGAGGLPVPPTIGALLAARLDRLPDMERRLLERAAVVGRTFSARALAELLPDAERADLPRRLGWLARRNLIRPERSDFPDDEAYRFRHLLIRDAAYAGLPKRERAELHERFADWLEGRSAANRRQFDLILGYHLEQAYLYRLELGDDGTASRLLADRALDFIAPAGQAAEERGDPHAAISLLRRAVALAPQGRRRIESLISLRASLRTAGEHEVSEAADAEAVALLAAHPDEGLAARRWLADAWFEARGTIAESESAYAYFESVGDTMGMLRALELAILMHSVEGRFTASLKLLDQAMDLALEIGRPDRAATLFRSSAYSLDMGPEPVPQALLRLRRYLDLAGTDRAARAVILMSLGQLEAMSGKGDQWRSHFEAAKAIIDDLGLVDPFGAFMYPTMLGTTEVAIGEPARVVDMLQESCSALDRLADRTAGLASMAPLTAQALLAVGRVDEVERYAFWARDIAAPADVDAQVRWRIAISGLRSTQARHDEAINLAREALERCAGSEFVGLARLAALCLAGALRASGDQAGSVDAAREARRLASAKQDQATVRRIEAFLEQSG